ncbi:MAG TPA: PRC-barrel domain-containing protein [Geopsychrobacteraceae bacterium]|nr:PRC-barrel domain-containing protein [Geopsychrobacteraceae bacterium]
MLRSVKKLNTFQLSAVDGNIGRCEDLLFDDRPWIVRYVVADTGTWLAGRKVLILPAFLGKVDGAAGLVSVELLKNKLEKAPGLDRDAPVSRQYEIAYHTFFGIPYYRDDPAGGEKINEPATVIAGQPAAVNISSRSAEAHLRSADEVIGHSIRATDGELGQVEDFILDDETWYIQYLVVATGSLVSSKKFLVTPALLGIVDWEQGTVNVHMTGEQLRKCPEYDSPVSLNS